MNKRTCVCLPGLDMYSLRCNIHKEEVKTKLQQRKETLGKRLENYKPKPDEKVEVRGD